MYSHFTQCRTHLIWIRATNLTSSNCKFSCFIFAGIFFFVRFVSLWWPLVCVGIVQCLENLISHYTLFFCLLLFIIFFVLRFVFSNLKSTQFNDRWTLSLFVPFSFSFADLFLSSFRQSMKAATVSFSLFLDHSSHEFALSI